MNEANLKIRSLSDTSESSDDDTKNQNASSSFYSPIKSSLSAALKRKHTSDQGVSKKESDSDEDEAKKRRKEFSLPPKKKPLPRGLSVEEKPKSNYNAVAKRMMEKMGFQEGKGLGKHGQGRTEIIETSKQRGRRGLGRKLQGLEPEDVGWDFDREQVVIEETPIWLPECPTEPPSLNVLRTWVREGPKKTKIDDEVEFCDPSVLEEVLSCKSVFDELEPEEMRRARTRSNPYETIRGGMFLNRAAMKMANMDSVFDFMFTKPVDEAGKPLVEPNELLYFADVCAGPGGFSEYVLWRKGWEAKGFGFTLRGANDFKLEDFFSGHCESFEPHYGVNGISGDGDVFVSNNQREFRRFVLQSTGGKGVHFMMADGGFSVEGQENIQEVLSKQLYLCQFLVALYILRPGGHFVCKLFDIFTPFSVGLVYLMYRCFKKVCVHKPVTSRPANSERYIVCKWRREGVQDVSDFFYEVNCRLNETSSVLSNKDVLEIVPLDVMKGDVGFYDYITESNNALGKQQIQNLAKIRTFYKNTNLHEDKQSDIRKRCLELWKVPDKVRSAPARIDPQPRFEELIKDKSHAYLSYLATNLDRKLLSSFKGLHDYFCVVSSVKKGDKSERLFILGLGRHNVFKWDGSSTYKWDKIDVVLEIPRGTLLYGEFVNELQGEGKGQRKTRALHIIDALVLGGKDIRNLPYQERIARIEVFSKAISKPSRPDYAPIRAKKIYRFSDIEEIFNSMEEHMVKGVGKFPRLCYSCTEDRFFSPQGILFLKVVNDPWMIGFSHTRKSHYYFNTQKRTSVYETPPNAVASFRSSFEKRIFWSWDDGAEAYLNGCLNGTDKVDKETILQQLEKLKSTC